MEQREKTEYYHAFDLPPATDPKSDLEDMIERKGRDLRGYMSRKDHNEVYCEKLLSELKQLENIKNKLHHQRLYPIWVQVEKRIDSFKNDVDGITIRIPLVENPQDDRFHFLDFTKKNK